MKRIGLIGGLSWESTRTYYDVINELAGEALGEEGNPEILLYSININKVYPPIVEKKYAEVIEYMGNAAVKLEEAGAEMLLICSNTPHVVAPELQKMVNIPFIHIADALGHAVKKKGLTKLALLGTPVTMNLSFYKEYLKEKYNIETMPPDIKYHQRINDTIFNELEYGIIKQETLEFYLDVIESCKKQGAEGVILGCTEIPLIVKQEHCDIPVFDTSTIHASYAVKKALEK